jgi:NAD(P)-dependent dehydrogenase (short-subunit alcohol dehydrogenase family)
MSRPSEKIALVIGAAGGVGGDTAAALIRHGWSVRGLTLVPGRPPLESNGSPAMR